MNIQRSTDATPHSPAWPPAILRAQRNATHKLSSFRDGIYAHRIEIAIVLALVALAAALRLIGLVDVPPGMHGDEAITAEEARRILDEGPIGVWSPSIHGQPAGPFYWVAAWFTILPETQFTVRLTTALLGIAAVPLFYLFCRELLGVRAAVIGTITIAVSYWAIHFSRTAFPLATMPVAECAALYLLVRGLRRGEMWTLIAGGAFAGTVVYTYGSAPLFALPLIVAGLLFVIGQRQRPGISTRRATLLLSGAAVAAIAVAAPYLWFAAQNPDVISGASHQVPFTSKEEFTGEDFPGKVVALAERFYVGLTIYFTENGRDDVDALGMRGLLGPLASVLMVVGIVVAVIKVRDWRYGLLVSGWIAGSIPVVILSVDHTDREIWAEYRRTLVALPFVMALVGAGGSTLLNVLPRLPRMNRAAAKPAIAVAGVVFLAIMLTFNVRHYFNEWANDDFTRWVFGEEMVLAARNIEELNQDNVTVYFYSERWSFNYPTLRFLFQDVNGIDRSVEHGDFTLERTDDSEVAWVFMQKYVKYGPEIPQVYPDGTYVEERDDDGNVILAIYHIDPEPSVANPP